MSEWKEYKVSDLAEEIAMGPFGSNIKVDNFIDYGIPVLNGSNIQGFKLNEDSFNYVSEEKANSLGRANAYKGDIVITHRGTLGQIVYIPQNSNYNRYVISQSQFRLKLKPDLVRPDFFVYYFHTREGQHKILMNASQVGVPALARPTSTFKEVSISLPSIETQTRIMQILSSLDDKIEVNRRINENLEQQAQALFKSWFVDFEPFKDGEFVESELGMIPKGWRVGKLSEIANITMGTSPAGSSYNITGNGDVFYQGRAEFGFRFPRRNMYTTEAKRFADIDSVLLSVRAPVGDINVAEEKCCIGRGLSSIQSKDGNNSFILYLMQNLKPEFEKFNGEGTVFGSINKKALEDIIILIPQNELIKRFERIGKEIDGQIKTLDIESRRLASLRDALLPRLMSGEIKVDDINN